MDQAKTETASTKAPGATAAKKAEPASAAPAATANTKKKRTNSRPPQEAKSAKKKKKETEGGTKKKKKADAATPAPLPPSPPDTTTTAATTTTTPAPPTTSSTSGAAANLANKPLIDQVLYRLTEGIPRYELKAMVREADECEANLIQEIQLLEEALKREAEKNAKPDNKTVETTPPLDKSTAAETTNTKTTAKPSLPKTQEELDKQVDAILENPFTPLDRCFTLSALLGRLRDDLAIPSTRQPSPGILAATAGNTNKRRKANSNPAPTYPQLVALADNPNYTRVHPDPPNQLLNVWKKIAGHRTATVFRRPVRPEEAPGYAERILFPMDLSLVRKMIVARILTSYAEVHQKIRLISHNCVKYNGRCVQ
jgi:Bromodomain